MFANNKNLKNTSKIYVDLEYYEELENINKQNIQEISIKLVETIKLLNNAEMTKNINELNEEEKQKILKRIKNIF